MMPDQLPDSRPRRGIYDLAAPLYDAVSACIPFERGLRECAVTLLGAPVGGHILDVGCGTGLCLDSLAQVIGPTGAVVGIDPSAASLARAQRRALRLGCALTTIAGDAAAQAFAAATFDGAIAAFSISVIADWKFALAQVHTALKPGAVLVVLEQRYASRKSLAGRFGAALNKLLSADPERDFAQALQTAGFTVQTHSLVGGWYEIYVATRAQ
jgi:ubiquinone/menaquinone biosynthesis C-methylase UbiE